MIKNYKLLMWFRPVNEMSELVSVIPAPQIGEEFSWVWRSELIQKFKLFRKKSLRTPGGTSTQGWRPLL
jgi:hypothetical protein